MSDNVHNPAHYTAGGIETIDFIRAKLGPEGFRAYCLGNVLKYVTRHAHKNGDEDLRKAAVYLDWAVESVPAPPRAVEVPVVGMARPELGMAGAIPDYKLPEGPILTQAYGLGPGPAVDDDEPPLRAGTAAGDKL